MGEPSDIDPLDPYWKKRNFSETPEPKGHVNVSTETDTLRFVVQRHRARRLHYDLRLELNGVLVSWAVPKGPTLDPTARRAAFHVEDHPLDYFDFEGVIPPGQYGSGDVIVWDEGTWEHHVAGENRDPDQALRDGELHFDLDGHKLTGRFILIRTSGDKSSQERWLLLHKNDRHAVTGWDPEDHPQSVLSGRTNEEVKAAPDRYWHSGSSSSLPSDSSPAITSTKDRPSVVINRKPPSSAQSKAPTLDSDALEELEALGKRGVWHIYDRDLHVTNLDKVLFAGAPGEEPVTKRELLRYAASIASTALPYLMDRALNMHRFPDGAHRQGFWNKELPSHAPRWIHRWDNPNAREGETQTYLVVNEPAALIWAANLGALEWHAWTSKTSTPEHPTYALIDIDPGASTSWEDLLILARLHRSALEHLGVRAQPKVTGRRGIQIWVPVGSGYSFKDTRNWTERLSKAVGAVVPELVSWEWQVKDRAGLARLDFTQNIINKTLVAPYSPRAASNAPVSAPITWDELDSPHLSPDGFTIRNILARVEEKGDLFRTVLDYDQRLPAIT